jgi:peptidyl-prolyl cis-trans isomerase SurA
MVLCLMTIASPKRLMASLILSLALILSAVFPAVAQEDGFAPAAFVNGRVISQYEVRQRVLFMSLLRQPGDITALAVSTLIDDALRRDAAKRLNVTTSPEEIQAGMIEFASRAKLPIEDFLATLAKGGVAPETLRDFVEAGLLWRAVIRARFAESTGTSDAEVDRAIGSGAGSGGELRVLLSEIVLPTGGATDAMALAQRLKLTATTLPAFGMAAQNYSKAPTARVGGALGWIPVSALPPSIAPRILALKIGEISDPIVVPGAVQLFYLRDQSLAEGDAKGALEVDYLQFFAPSGTDLAAVIASVDTCDDLYDAAKGLPAESLQRATTLEAVLPAHVRTALAGLDQNEAAILSGAVPSVLMLCTRLPQSDLPASRDDISTTLLNTKLGLLAGAYLEELRSNAIIKIQ